MDYNADPGRDNRLLLSKNLSVSSANTDGTFPPGDQYKYRFYRRVVLSRRRAIQADEGQGYPACRDHLSFRHTR